MAPTSAEAGLSPESARSHRHREERDEPAPDRSPLEGVGCRVQGVGCRVEGEGCGVEGVGCRVEGARCRVGVGCGVQVVGLRV